MPGDIPPPAPTASPRRPPAAFTPPPFRRRWLWLFMIASGLVGLFLIATGNRLPFFFLLSLCGVVLVFYALAEGALRARYGSLLEELNQLNLELDSELERRELADRQLRAANRRISTLYRAGAALLSTLQVDLLGHLILSLCVSTRGGAFPRAMLFAVQPRSGELQGVLGLEQPLAELIVPPAEDGEGWGELHLDPLTCMAQRATPFSRAVAAARFLLADPGSPLARACAEGRLVLVDAATVGGDFAPLAAEWGLGHLACAPLPGSGGPLAVLVVELDPAGNGDSTERLRFLELFARQASAALENARLHQCLEVAHRELRETQEQLVHGERLAVLGEMSAQLAHELRNPLVAVGGFAQRLARLGPADPRAGEYAAIIVREVRRLEEMLDNILGFSRHQPLAQGACDLVALLDEALELAEELHKSAAIRLVRELAPLPTVVGDSRQLRQVLLNLLTNACQAMPDGGILTVRAAPCRLRGEEAVAVEVEDTGGGIDAEILRNIFNPFFSTRPRGTGLGLSLAHRVVEQHRGVIEVINGAAGARFTVRLPLNPAR